MGMSEKLLRSYIAGCNDTWDLVEAAIQDIPGIGPKTHKKMMHAIKTMASNEVEVLDTLRPNDRKKLLNTIDEIGFKQR
jgi:Holliday junction resolvasome RuvABC DNA-binding subunit